MADENKPVSPTGEPLIPQSVVRWLLPMYLIMSGSGITLMTQLDASPKALAIGSAVVGVLGALLGMSSQGVRK